MDPNARTPLWAFRIVDLGGPWCWTAMREAEAQEVLRRLASYETMTWREIDGPSGSHAVAVASLSKAARDRLLAIGQDDANECFSLRIKGSARVWGIRDEHVLGLLWWDPHHEVCPSPRKHT
ncbi:MAG TPA: hypothetical protein VJT67_14675 [Longimicrobiaceae bacterium]|nr:hypothetical protein [Longimicrobiaceae bacterium]